MYWRQIKIALFVLLLAPFLVWVKAWFIISFLLIVATFFFNAKSYNKLLQAWFPLPKLAKRAFLWFWVIVSSTLVVFFVKTYVVDIFRLPSTSMQPETSSGDIILINKLLMGPRLWPNDSQNYERAWGYSSLKHNDLIIFNFPEGDTILRNQPTESYYALKRTDTSNNFDSLSITQKQFKRVAHRPRYIKRVIGLPGDTFEIIKSQLFINHKLTIPSTHYIAKFEALDSIQADSVLNSLSIKPVARITYRKKVIYELDVSLLANNPQLAKRFKCFSLDSNLPDPNVFPHTFLWNSDNMGPLIIPKKNQNIEINAKNIELYARIISVYEENKLEVNGKQIFINGKISNQYTFKMNYYWVMGDNQPHSFDSRYWGFLPENHIIGISRTHFHF